MLMLMGTALFSQNATIDLTSEHQVIKGYGAINHPVWYSDLNAAERELAFGNSNGQMGLTVLRIWVSDNSSQWSLELATAKAAVQHGAVVFATPWNPPSSMTYTDGTGQKRIKTSSFGAYAKHLNDFVTYMRNNGVELYAISVQNEPDYAHQWTKWTEKEVLDFIKGYADQIDCRLMTAESFSYVKSYYDPILNDADALSKVDIFGTHLYGTPVSNFPYALFKQKGAGKELWMTEVYTDSKFDANLWNDGIINEDRHALHAAEHIHHAMVSGNFQTYVWWPIRRYYALIHDGEPDGKGSPTGTAGTITKRGWCVAQFSKFIRPGYIRVGATENPLSDVFVSAYKNGDDVVIVAVNMNTSSKTVNFSIPGTKVASWENYTTSATKNAAKGSDIKKGGSFSFTMAAASVTTFVGIVDAGAPAVTITAPADDSEYSSPATFTVTADASDEDGTIAHVDFYLDDATTAAQAEWSAPYSFELADLEAGLHTIRAVAYDNEDKTGEDLITVSVQGPYNGTPQAIPGTVEFEYFDLGGNGHAYSDNSEGNDGNNDFRSAENIDADIEICKDTDAGYNLGFATAGEWLEYTVDVAATGTYALTIRAACENDDRTISLAVDGVDIATDIAMPNTTGWQIWDDVSVGDVELQAGEHIIRLTIGANNYINLNYMKFEARDIGPIVSISAPKDNAEFLNTETITINATATSTNSTIASVAFYAPQSELLFTDDSAPYSFEWSGMDSGKYYILAEATDATGSKGYDSVFVTVLQGPIQLKTGWNLVGCPIAGNTEVASALSSIWNNVVTVKDPDGFYNKTVPEYLNSLTTIKFGQGYFIKVDADCELDWTTH